MSRGVRVSTYNGHARKRKCLLGTNYVDDTIVFCAHRKMLDSKLFAVCFECLNLLATHRIIDHILLIRWSVVIRHCNNMIWTEYFDSFVTQRIESLRRCYLMCIETVNVQLSRTIFYLFYDVCVPDFVKESIHRF